MNKNRSTGEEKSGTVVCYMSKMCVIWWWTHNWFPCAFPTVLPALQVILQLTDWLSQAIFAFLLALPQPSPVYYSICCSKKLWGLPWGEKETADLVPKCSKTSYENRKQAKPPHHSYGKFSDDIIVYFQPLQLWFRSVSHFVSVPLREH